ncbi:MAG: Eco57I restriction-modification methylase domain-containing protein [Roseiflexaceae bacterium]
MRPDPATLKQIYDHSLIVLYRLLFILYAEARELLPLRTSATYREEYSLDTIKREIARRRVAGVAVLPTTAQRWAKLKDLFQIINEGSPPLQVATFNGGLFDPAKHPFLEQYTVGDARLMEAIDMLARVGGEFVDYRDLAERHLGTIYEGLLEYHLQPIFPEGHWTIDLFNDRGERHRTGSYYTPDFVVQYIVVQTLQPVLDAAVAGKQTDAERIAAVLSVNVADPAMGSGHFPVAAMEYIARYLVDLGVTPPADDRRPTTDDRPPESPGSMSVVRGPWSVVDSDLAYWKRRVAQNCIYGVDLNPLAVDLAKLSLWLATAARGKPLSFLDHHLRCGNALIGARIAQLDDRRPTTDDRRRRAAKQQPVVGGRSSVVSTQLSMLDDADFARSMGLAVGSMWLIEETAGNTIAEVREQERLYADLRAALTRKYQQLADVAAARDFGLAVDATLWRGLSDYLARPGGFALPQYAALLDAAHEQAERQRFFHWDLEFPEVFFDRHGQPLGERGGFDAVIGNPPYVRQEQLAPIKPYLAQAFQEVYQGTADLYIYFVAQGLRVLRRGGRLAYISSNSWLRANYAGLLRNFLRTQATVEQLIDLGDNRVFADVPDVYPAILVARRDPPNDDHSAQVAVFSRGEGVKQFAQQIEAKLTPVSIYDQADIGWQLGDDAGRGVFAKLMAVGRPLIDVVDGQMYRGVVTGRNEVFIIDQVTRDQLVKAHPTSTSILKRLVRGEDLNPWYQEDEARWLVFTRRGINIDTYPAVKAYLEPFRSQLEPKPENWNDARPWLGRKPGPYRWYEIQDSIDYYAQFEQPKIFWPDIAKFPRFSWDISGAFSNDKGFFTVPSDHSILGILQSRAIWLCISNLCVPLGERAGIVRYQQKIQFISRLPIPDAPAAERDAIGDLAMRITAEARARYDLHRKARNRILADLGTPDKTLNQKLTAWWNLDFATFRAEIQKVFKRDIPLKDRDDWEEWLTARRAEHQQRTETIVRMETDLNARVYVLFDLTPAEIRIIENSTKYRYGEV